MTGLMKTEAAQPHVAKLMSFAPLTPGEENLLRLLPRLRLKARSDLSPYCSAEHPNFIISGWAAQYRSLRDARRQIIQLLAPGDAIGLPIETAARGEAVIALTELRLTSSSLLATTPTAMQRGIRIALERAAGERVALLQNQVVRLGRQTAVERLSNLLLELEHRARGAGWLGADGSLAMPLTQETLGDLLGLSIVHVNRTLQALRSQRVIELSGGRLRLMDHNALENLAEFRSPAVRGADS